MTEAGSLERIVEIASLPIKLVSGQWIRLCPPGFAVGCFELRDRGRNLLHEITCWPSYKQHLLTTGRGNGPQELKKSSAYECYLSQQLGFNDVSEFHYFVARWQAEARVLAYRNERDHACALHKRKLATMMVKAAEVRARRDVEVNCPLKK